MPRTAKGVEQTFDANSFPIANVHKQGNAADVDATNLADTVSSNFKTIIGDAGDALTTYYAIEVVADGDLRYLFGTAPEVTATTGSRLPDGTGKPWTVLASDLVSVIGETGSVTLNITRLL